MSAATRGKPIWLGMGLVLLLLLSGCGAGGEAPTAQRTSGEQVDESHTAEFSELTPAALDAGEKLRVVATLNLLGDVVRNVGGDHIELTSLLPIGADPHTYSASPADLRTLSDAHVIFMVGAGVEESLMSVVENREGGSVLIAVNTGLDLLTLSEVEHGAAEEQTADVEDHHHAGLDPHTWMSVPNVEHWVETIAHTLSALDPANAEAYATAAAAYTGELAMLEQEIVAAVATIPPEQRKLVTDHDVFAYFAAHYGFTLVGAVVPALSTSAEPSAQELAALQEQIKAQGVPAIFVGTTVNPALEEQIASDLGIKVVALYTESLSAPNGAAPTYLDFMRYNVKAIVETLQKKPG
jgi:manganese/iron transport system substrate-binding protein